MLLSVFLRRTLSSTAVLDILTSSVQRFDAQPAFGTLAIGVREAALPGTTNALLVLTSTHRRVAMPRIVYVAAALTTTAHALRQTNAARLTLFGDGCGFRAARLDATMRGHPAVVAAERCGRLGPILRFIREVLGVEDATDLLETTPQLASMPLAVLAARHA